VCDAEHVSFFDDVEPPPPPRAEPDYRPPAWAGPPENVLPAAVALDAVLGQTEETAVAVIDARAYPTGLALGLSVVRRTAPPPGAPPGPFFSFGPRAEGDPRFGVRFADGRRAVLEGAPRHTGGPDIRLSAGGGGGGSRRWDMHLWLWPLPPAGPLTLAFVWPAEGIDEHVVAIDAEPIRAAAARAVELWPDDRPPRPGGGASATAWSAYDSGG
jgi:hypothetical protein